MTGQTETIINAILGGIDSGALTPGDMIEEHVLMQKHDVSRTPVREALIQLETTGLIQRMPRKGAIVFKPTLEEFLAILEVHTMLLGQAASLAARRLSPGHAAKLESAVADCEAHTAQHGNAEPDQYYRLDAQFHRAIAEAAGNPFLRDLIQNNSRKLAAYYRARARFGGALQASVSDHRALATLITTRQSQAAQIAMENHLNFDLATAMDLLASMGK